jgi:hypothetical protein
MHEMPPEKRHAKEFSVEGMSQLVEGQYLNTTKATMLTTRIPQTSQNHPTQPTILHPLPPLQTTYPTINTQTDQPKTELNTLPTAPP